MARTKIERDTCVYAVRLEGRLLYRLCHLLEDVAVESPHYVRLRECVELAEEIRRQAREQGWPYEFPRGLA